MSRFTVYVPGVKGLPLDAGAQDAVAALEQLPEWSPETSLGDGPIDARVASHMNKLARLLDTWFREASGERWGFVLITAPFSENEGRANYISNVQREDVVKLLEEQVQRFKDAK